MVQNTSQNPLSSFLRNYGVTSIPKIAVVNHEQEEEETISSSSSDYESSECSHTTAEDMIMATNQPEVKTEDSKVDPMDTATPSTATTPPTIGAKYNFTIDDSPMENDVINGLKDSRNFTHGWRHKSLPEKVTMKS
ncbi:hypothetical protein V6N11_038624 [Hibiscus sabdariffa]|uniref:Uncharacterized protein n=1 Tax=Hibiscus sabdariffa TaxID=183260 RepID=A0ABR2SKI7_9ROSI